MALLDKFLKKTLSEEESYTPLNALVCFSKQETGIALCKIANYLLQSNVKNEQISSLHLVEKEEYNKIENIEEFKTSLYEEILEECKKGSAMIRTFIKPSDDFVNEILTTSEELECNIVLIGIGKSVLTPKLWGSYQKFKSHQDSAYEVDENQNSFTYKGVSSLLERNERTTGIFIDNSLDTIDSIFIPILDNTDIHIFDYIKRMAERTQAKITLWDAIGVINSIPELKKSFQIIQRNADKRVSLWDNSKKIDYEYIQLQDLVVIGFEGWIKLISSAISWSHSLPSTLIIRKKLED